MVHKYPHEVTIYAGGPLTNLAQAISLDPKFPELAQELVVMGGSIAPVEPMSWAQANRREFNFWWDPEAVHIVLRAPWAKITVTTVDISVKTRMTKDMIEQIAKAGTPAAKYIGKWADEEYLWDELAAAAWLDPSIITKEETLYMDIDISHTAGYGNTLVWVPGNQPGLGERLVHVQTRTGSRQIQQEGDRPTLATAEIEQAESLKARELAQKGAPKRALVPQHVGQRAPSDLLTRFVSRTSRLLFFRCP